ncbi:MAG: CPBP family intramembrane glutamic endopeptidase [Bacillota bacterium]
MFNLKIKDFKIIVTILLAIIFWYLTFSVQLLNFWLSMSIAATTLSFLAINWGGNPFKREDFNIRTIMIGTVSAIILYGVFLIGNFLSQLLFDFAKPQVSSIYNIRTQAEAIYITLVLLFITSPGEEIFWRNYLQRWSMQKFGQFKGWIIASLIYAGVHISSGNFMLVMAALIAGLFWGYIYWKENNTLAVTISHALWTTGIFVFLPVI